MLIFTYHAFATRAYVFQDQKNRKSGKTENSDFLDFDQLYRSF